MTVLALTALLLPGLAWWAWLGRRKQDPLVSLAQILGISLSLIALLAQAAFLLHLRFSPFIIGLLLAALAALAVTGLIKRPPQLPVKYRWHLLIGLLLFGGLIALRLYQARERLYQARELLLPAWVDSQHHYLIIRAILENRGLPDTLAPYLPVPFYYHFGFHAAAALFTALSGLPIGAAMLLLGQVLNAAISLSIYALGKALFDDWRPAAAAALLVGFATRMPAYYLSWGRSTLTAGMVLLPLAMAAALHLLQKPRSRRDTRLRDSLTLGVVTAGVLLSHYFASVLLAGFLLLLIPIFLIPRWSAPLTAVLRFAPVPLGTGLGLVLAAPWLLRVARYSPANTGVGVRLPQSFETLFSSDRWDYIRNLLGPVSNHALLIAAAAGLLLALILRQSVGFGLWSLLVGVLALPIGISLGPFRPDHFAIVLFLPAALWVGWLAWTAGYWLGGRLGKRWIPLALLALVVIGWAGWSLPMTRQILNPVTVMATQADLDALDWAAANTPPEARFFINTTYWLGGIHRGVDGGGWLLPYAGRWALVPTVFYSFSPDRDAVQQVRGWGERASTITTCSADFWALAAEAALDHIYIREGVGGMQPEGLAGCDGIRLVYAQEDVYIYAIEY